MFITMLQICDSAILVPLTILFKNCISQGIFSDNCPIHKKGDKQIVDNYRPVSLYQFLEELNLLSTHKYSFRSNDSCINQLLFIDHTLYKAFQVFFWICSKLLITFGMRGYFIEGLFYYIFYF